MSTESGGEATPIGLHLVASDALEEFLDTLPGPEAQWLRANGFNAALGQHVAMPGSGGAIDRVILGWGTARAHRRTRFAIGAFAAKAPAGTYRIVTPLEKAVAEEVALGWLLSRYRFDHYRGGRSDEAAGEPAGEETSEADLLVPDGVDGERLGVVAEGVFITRDLINTPANDMGPARLEDAARRLAERHGASMTAIVGDDLLAQNFPLIHTVGRAAAEPPRLVDLNWGRADAPRVTLIGKGVTFDTGGLNLKPSGSMGLMKKDMGGAATVLGLAHMIMALGLDIRLRVLLGIAENAVAGGSFRPGDVLRARNGKTVEVNNTDAEGRLVLADALALAAEGEAAGEGEPGLIADFATLTGAARVALGPDVVPFYTDDDALAAALANASQSVRDPLWRMPLHDAYETMIEPKIADLDNAPSGGAGSITAALFLRRFAGDGPWVHFDIYGWTPSAKPGRPVGGEAQAARALLTVLEARHGASHGASGG
ncbi:MAG: leucyl aminopeptidase family protein [Pseudomonadota bacterium]